MKHIPNILTITRIVTIPIFVFAIYHDSSLFRYILLGIFVLLAVTDFLDGFIARKYNLESVFGRVLDPIADKIIVIAITIILIARDPILAKFIIVPTIVIVSREFAVSGLREYLAHNYSFSMPPTFMAKSKTAVQLISIGFLIIGKKVSFIYFSVDAFAIGVILFWVSGVMTAITGYQYISKGIACILKSKQEK